MDRHSYCVRCTAIRSAYANCGFLSGTLQFYIEEGRGHVDYLGYVRPKAARDNTDDHDRLVSVQFAWGGEEKNVSRDRSAAL